MSEKLNFSIGVDLTELNRDLKKATGSISDFADRNKQKFEEFGRSMTNLGSQLSILSLAALGLGAASVKMASDFEESMNKVDVAFGSAGEHVKAFAKESLETFGIAEGTALDMAALFGDMATSMGLPQKEAANMSTALVGLAGDLASFKNIGIAQATTALNGVFTGETESLKMLGIVMTEANLQQFAYTQGIKENIQSLTQAQKVQLRYQYIIANTTNAQGDFARTGGGAANQMRVFQERLKEVSTQLGSIILPYFTKFITYVNGLVKSFQELSPTVQKIIVVVGALVAAAAPLALAIGAISSALPAIIAGFTLLAGPVGLVVAGIVALTAAIVYNWDVIKQWANDVVNYFIRLYNESMLFRAGIESVVLIFKNLFETIKFVFGSIYTIITTVFSNIYEYLRGVAKLIFAVLTFDVAAIKRGLGETIGAIRTNVSGMLTELTNKSKTLFQNIAENQKKAIDNVLNGKVKEVDWSTSEESKKKLTDDVAGAVSAGVAQGMAGNAKVKPVNAGMQPLGVAQQPDLAITTTFLEAANAADMGALRIAEIMYNFNQDMDSLIMGSLMSTFSNLGNVIGEALATGGNVAQAIGQSLLKSFANFISELGDLLIQYGTFAKIKGTIDAAVATGGPAAILAGGLGIAAGIALKAIGSAISSRVQGGLSGGSVGAGGASQSYGNGGSFSSSVSADRTNEVIFRISGSDLLGVLRRAEGNELRLG